MREYHVGDRVTVRAAYPPGHVRAPWYVRGRSGTIHERLGEFDNPEVLAYGRTGDPRTLYRVRFDASALWGEAAEPATTLVADIFDHWLVPLERKGEDR